MTTADLVDQLSRHRAISGAPAAELTWLAEHGTLMRLGVGDVLTPKTGPVRGLFIVLTGQLAIYVDRGNGPQKVMGWQPGDITGLLPYSRMVAPPSDVVVEEAADVLAIERDLLPLLTRECPGVTAICVHIMVDRARTFTTSDLQNEKMLSLGKLAAGLAHELNNPASAVTRSAESLDRRLLDVETASRAFGAAALTGQQLETVTCARTLCLDPGATQGRSAMARADREEWIADWLVRHDVDGSAADALVDSAITEEMLERLAAAIDDDDALQLALNVLVAECAAHQLVSEIQTAAARIYKLVAAVKGFTYMDQATAQKPVDIAQGLSDTLTVLNQKARARSIVVTLEIEPDLPHVMGLGGGLNQVWANLVDNAIDAAASTVLVSATRAGTCVAVRVADDGAGMPPDVQKRIFDPFFTTKPIGEGTGLGLDTARRVVIQHRGTISVNSGPGRTEFVVTLPIDPGKI